VAAPWQFLAGWRGLGVFWLAIAALLTAAGLALHVAGPLAPPSKLTPTPQPEARNIPPEARDNPQQPANSAPAGVPAPSQQARAVRPGPPGRATPGPGRTTPGPIADPDPALLEPAPDLAPAMLPRIADDGRMPMQVYAAGFDGSSRRPRVGLVLAGLGLNQADSEAAVRALPHGITLAISPYAPNPGRLLSTARSTEHEYLVSIPMEPQSFPLNDPGKQALMTSLSLEQNRTRLIWVLSRVQGYVGGTGAEGEMRGERFASLPEEMGLVLGELSKRGLLYIDPRPGSAPAPQAWSRSVDIVVDEPPTAADIDIKLARLARIAKEKGSALGLAGTARPVLLERLSAWATNLEADGLALAPVSALVQAPAGQ
jgi:polysaccharide deacetylase 2 family uncharacterized protein YibQ